MQGLHELVYVIKWSKNYQPPNITSTIFKFQIFLFYDQLAYSSPYKTYVKSHSKNCYGNTNFMVTCL